MHPSIIPLLEAKGYVPDYRPKITELEVFEIIDSYVGLVVRSKIFIGAEILKRAKKLRFIARAGAGMDQIVEDEVRQRNITLINAPEGNRDAVAEHAIGMILSLFNKINTADREVRNGIWLREENRGIELAGKTVGIIGYGNNGKAFAKRLKGFECEVLTFDILKKNVMDENAKPVSMEDIFERADIVSFHVPLTEKTDRLANEAFFNKFRKNIWLINTSRGQVVILKDLLNMIDQGKVLGAALDVLEIENLSKFKAADIETYTRLINNQKVILTPHVAGWTQESYIKINEVLVEKIGKLAIEN
jgi:D-3-phosphoglycerate dehydrogenase